MNRHCEKLIEILKEPIETRQEESIRQVTAWMRLTVPTLKSTKSGVIADVIRYGFYVKYLPGQIVVTHSPGDDDSFYIVLSGSASVYVSSKQKAFQWEQRSTADAGPLIDRDKIQQEPADDDDAQNNPNQPQDSGGGGDDGEPDYNSSDIVSRTESVVTAEEKTGLINAKDCASREGVVSDRRSSLGKFSAKIGAGKCIGGIARMTDDSLKNATVVSDDVIHLLCLSRDAFNRTLKPSQEEELRNRQDFIAAHPLFVGWSLKSKNLLESLLSKQMYDAGQTIVQQGDEYYGLVFVLSGRANVQMEPERHKVQYSHLSVFTNQSEDLKSERTKNQKKPESVRPPVILEPIMVRRRFGYAAAESRLRNRRLNLCCVESGEIIGDVELVSKLDSYCQTVTPTEPVEAYVLSAKGIERIGSKSLAESMNILKLEVETKLSSRMERMKDNVPELFPRLLMKMRTTFEETPMNVPSLTGSKSLPPEEELFQHLLKSFVENRSSLVPSYVSGGVFYLDMMRTRAKQRHAGHEISAKTAAKLRLHRTMPLTSRAIKVALKRQEAELELVEETARLQEVRSREEQRTKYECNRMRREMESMTAATPPLTEKAMMSLQQVVLNKIRLESSHDVGDGLDTEEVQEPKGASDLSPFAILQSIDSAQKQDEEVQRKISFRVATQWKDCDSRLAEDPSSVSLLEDGTHLARDEPLDIEENLGTPENETAENFPTSFKRKNIRKARSNTKSPSESGQERDRGPVQRIADSSLVESADAITSKIQRTEALSTECDYQSEPVNVQRESDGDRASPEGHDAREVHSARASPAATTEAGTNRQRLPPHEARKRKGAVVLALARELCEERAKFRLKRELIATEEALYDSPLYRDWETSERSLKYLEQRIARFHRETDREAGKTLTSQSLPFLPKLRRFEPMDDTPRYAAPGGKVYVKRRSCDVKKADGFVVKNHSHVRFHLLSSIPNYSQLRTSKLVTFQILDDERQKWTTDDVGDRGPGSPKEIDDLP